MKLVIFGATGMVGRGALLEALDDPRVTSVLVVARRSVGVSHPKLVERVHLDFLDFTPIAPDFANAAGCLFCLGVSAARMTEAQYRHLTYDLTMAAAGALYEQSPRMTFCYVSGRGTDSTEHGRMMWARVKGATENALLGFGFGGAYMFRPGFILPERGVRSQTRMYDVALTIARPLFPLIRRLPPRWITSTTRVGRALVQAVAAGYERRILESPDINALAGRSPLSS